MKSPATLLLASALTCLLMVSPHVPARSAEPPARPEHAPPAVDKPAAKPAVVPSAPGEPYTLATCPVSGDALGSMGDPIVKSYDGREIRFCCKACPATFEAELAKNLAKVDEALSKDQLPHYPLDTSVVSGKPLPEKPIDWVVNNRLIRLAEETEKAEFQKDPAKYLAALDKAVVEKQGPSYALKSCPVSKEQLGSMGKPKSLVIGGRLIQLCCSSCVKDVRKSPAQFIAALETASKQDSGTPTDSNSHKPAERSHDK